MKLYLLIAGIASLLVAMTFLGGCRYEDMVKVTLPTEIAQRTGSPSQVPLSQIKGVVDTYDAMNQRDAIKRKGDFTQWQVSWQNRLKELSSQFDAELATREADEQLWASHLTISKAEFDRRIARATETVDIINSVLNTGLSALGDSGLAAVPAGGAIIGVLSFLAGRMNGRTVGRSEAETAGYDAGRQEAIDTITKVKGA